MRRSFANLGLQAMSIHWQGINHTMQFLRCSAPHLTFRSFMQTGTLIAWKTSFSFVDVKIVVVFRPCCPFIVNTKLRDDEWTLRTNKSQVLYIPSCCEFAFFHSYHYRQRTLRSLPPSDEPSKFYLLVSSHHYIQYLHTESLSFRTSSYGTRSI